MKRLIKSILRPFWRMTHPIRRPVFRRLDARINHMIAVAIRAQLLAPLDASTSTLERLAASVEAANHSARLLACDMDLMLASVVREIARLQNQVEILQDAVDRQAPPQGRAGLSLVDSDDDGEPIARHAGVERAKVG
jgi:hypothetical protein